MKYQYTNREISWLHFNARVLQEAESENTPLQERLNFLGIFSSNLDEFFCVRVATIHRLLTLNQKKYPIKAQIYQDTLDQIYEITKTQQKRFANAYINIIKDLKKNNLFVINEKELTTDQGDFIRSFFREKVRPHLFPVMIKKNCIANYLKDDNIYLAITLHKQNKEEKPHNAIIKIPTENISRFIVLPSSEKKQYVIFLDDVIRFCLDDIFSMFQYTHYNAYTFKFTRDAELDIDEDISKSFLEIMSDSLKKRTAGSPVRFIYDKNMPKSLIDKLINKISSSKFDHLVDGGRYHNFKDFTNFPDLLSKKHSYEKLIPIWHKDLIPRESIFKIIKKKDILLHFPYHSFQHIIDFLREASIDPKVRSIKITLYRVANRSSIINALINAARNGKNVTVFLELQARFDEERNIYLSEKLQAAGVKIIASIPSFKVHSKLLIIRRKENDRNTYYSYVGTGNFNEDTARMYSDTGLLSSEPKITHEIQKVFEIFEASYRPMRFRNIIVSPFGTRNFFMKMIETEIENKEAGKDARICMKLNSLADIRIINKLYKASQAGVIIKLIVRGICVLVPGIPGVSDNIEVISIVDKFLEHSRIFTFANGGDTKVYIGSADLMGRNLDRRIEVTVPILDENLKKELIDILDIQLSDNVKARIIDNKFRNEYKTNNAKKVRTQIDTYNYLLNKDK
jgi:polyphosphate kinase